MGIINTIAPIATLIVLLGALIWIFVMGTNIFHLIAHKKKFSMPDTLLLNEAFQKWKAGTSIAVLAVLSLYLAADNTFLGLVGHHSLENLNGGIYSYYVQIESMGKNGKHYTLPGQIRVEVDSYDDGERRRYVREYCIEMVYFDNGSYLVFLDNDMSAPLKERVLLYDQYGNEWRCSIINQHAFSEHIKETSFISTRNILELVCIISIVLYNWLGCLYLDERKRQ